MNIPSWENMEKASKSIKWNKVEKHLINKNTRDPISYALLETGDKAFLVNGRFLMGLKEFEYYTKLSNLNEIDKSHRLHRINKKKLFYKNAPYISTKLTKLTWNNVKPVTILRNDKSSMSKEISNMKKNLKDISKIESPSKQKNELKNFNTKYKNVISDISKLNLTPIRKERIENVKNTKRNIQQNINNRLKKRANRYRALFGSTSSTTRYKRYNENPNSP